MDLSAFELQIFVSLIVVLGAAFVALVCDYLKGNNEQLREHNIELRVRKDEHERRGILDPARWLEQLVNITHGREHPMAGANAPRPRTMPVESHEVMNSWASRQDLERAEQRGASMTSRRTREPHPNVEDWVSPETMARVAAKMGTESDESLDPVESQPAVAESQGDIRDDIQRIVESSPKPRRWKPEPANLPVSYASKPAAATTETGTFRLDSGDVIAVTEPESTVAAESVQAFHSLSSLKLSNLNSVEALPGVAEAPPAVAARAEITRPTEQHAEGRVESVVPSLHLGRQLERGSQTQHRISLASQVVSQFVPIQVEPLELEIELRRVAETNAASTKTQPPVSALLDDVIAMSSHHGRREPQPVLQPLEPPATVTSRPLMETRRELSETDFRTVHQAGASVASEPVEVVVQVQAVAEAIAELEAVESATAIEPLPNIQVEPAPVAFDFAIEPLPAPPVKLDASTVVEQIATERPVETLPATMETAFSWPPARPFHSARLIARPSKFTANPQLPLQPAASIEEPRDLTCFEEAPPMGIPQVPEPAVFQAMIESISLMPPSSMQNDAQSVASDFQQVSDVVPQVLSGTQPPAPMASAAQSDYPLSDAPAGEPPALLLPAGVHDSLAFSRLLEAPGVLSGVVVSISLNDLKKIQDALTHQALEDLMRSIDKMMNGMIREQDFGVRLNDGEWVFVYRNEIGAVAQKRMLQISEKLWDFQLRSMGSVSILFGWGAVEVENERLSESYNASIERMEQSRRGRKTVPMETRDKRRVANG